MIPCQFNRYFESFLGGGAMFFYLMSKGTKFNIAYLSDTNIELITAYKVIKVNPKGVIELLQTYDIEYKKYLPYRKQQQEYYYQLRNARNNIELSSEVEIAARFIALNRTCFNGLYRVNRKGEFNVPPGSTRTHRFAIVVT